MSNSIAIMTMSYVALRVAMLAAFGMLFYSILRPVFATKDAVDRRAFAIAKPDRVPDDRC